MTPPGWWRRLDRLGRALENTLLVTSLLAMILLAVVQIVLRNVADTGLIWSDELLRLLVLWLALIGAVAASRDDHHIRIDLLSRALPAGAVRYARAVTDAFTAGVCAVIAWHALLFVVETRDYADLAFGRLPLWWFQSILPIGFGLISYRYVLWTARRLLSPTPERAS